MTILLAVLLGFCVDLILGDPRWIPHPVVYMGKAITRLERLLRRLLPDTPRALFWGGVVLAAVLPLGTLAFSAGVIWLAGRIHPALGFAVQVLWCWQALAVKDLRVETMHVYEPLCKGDLLAARKAVSRVVGRDTQSLTSEGVTKAAVETIAENFSDGVIAPMLYLFIGGAPLGLAYKAINTMDSMVGYKNDKYLYFGRAAAKLDDAAGYIPARPPLDFSANVSPLGVLWAVRRAVAKAARQAARYPDPLCRRLTEALALHEKVEQKQILCGNGAADLIFRVVLAKKPRTALVTAPTFAEYGQALETVDCRVKQHMLTEENGFAVTPTILEEITPELDMLFLCEPNNPTGALTEPVLLAGDIDRGGVFAQLYGTVALLNEEERKRVKGLIINKFRGDVDILRPGLTQLEELTGLPVVGVIPYTRVDIDDEDSLAPRLNAHEAHRPVDVAVIRLPHISNFTDFSPLESHPALGVRYMERPPGWVRRI